MLTDDGCRHILRIAKAKNKKARTRRAFGVLPRLSTIQDISRFQYGAPGGIRTHDPCLRRAVLYPAELLVRRGRHDTHMGTGRPVAGGVRHKSPGDSLPSPHTHCHPQRNRPTLPAQRPGGA